MLLQVFVFLFVFCRSCSCFVWFSDCAVVPASGCVCLGSEDRPHVICNDMELTDVPQLDERTRMELFDLSGNMFTIVSNNCFGNAVVNELILTNNQGTLNLDSCFLTANQMVAIIHLKLSNDGLLDVPSITRNMENLLFLDLSDNMIRVIRKFNFDNLDNLHRLELKGNPIQNVAPIFLLMPGLRELSLSVDPRLMSEVTGITDVMGEYNMAAIESLATKLTLEDFPVGDVTFLREFAHLESLRISRCSLRNEAVQTKGKSLLRSSRSSIQYIDLSGNKLKTFPKRMLHQARKLSHLDLSSNVISKVTYSCSSHPELVHLDLSKNRIRFLKISIDEGSRLTYLDLSDNRINGLESGAFRRARHLQYLNLSGNLLTSLSRESFPDVLPPTLTLYISNNPLKCDVGCRLQWLVWRIGQQFDKGFGPFSWYDVHNTICSDALGRHLWLLGMYKSGFKFFSGCILR